MRTLLMKSSISAFVAAVLLFAFHTALFAQAQTSDAPGVGLDLKGFVWNAGIINVAEGDTSCRCGESRKHLLSPGIQLKNGDVVQTRANGRIEILLDPGYYVRLSRDSELKFLDFASDNMKMKLDRGSAIVEVAINTLAGQNLYADEVSRAMYELITVVTPQAEIAITKGGVYRIDVEVDGQSSVTVIKGLAVVAGKRVETKNKLTLANGAAEVVKLEKTPSDPFYSWSKSRSARLVYANKAAKHTDWYKLLSDNDASSLVIGDDERPKLAQDIFTVSALEKAVKFAEPGTIYRRGNATWKQLEAGNALDFGDVVRTERDSRAEVRLYPTCYLHLTGETDIKLSEKSDGRMTVNVIRGSAIVGFESEAKDTNLVTFAAPGVEYQFLKKGIYRLSVAADGTSDLRVFRGKAGSAAGDLSSGKKAVFRGTGLSIENFNKRDRDGFDVWSEKRSQMFLVSNGWDRHLLSDFKLERVEYGGMWFHSPTLGEYTFVPGYWDYDSPYGGSYSTHFVIQRPIRRSSRPRLQMRPPSVPGRISQ
jgi:FecR protein